MTTLTTPVMPLDWPVFRDHADEQDLTFSACPDCLPWSIEVVTDHARWDLVIREWHAHDCPYLLYIGSVRNGGPL